MDSAGKYLSLIIGILVVCSVSVKTEPENSDLEVDPESLNLILSPKLLRALSTLLNPSDSPPVDTTSDSEPVSRQRRFSPSSRVDSKVTKLKTPKSEQDDGDVPVIRGLAGLSPIELRLLSQKEEQDDGKLIRTTTTTEKARSEKSVHKKNDDADVPIITGTKDANNPSRQEVRTEKSAAEDDNTVVLLNGATAQRVPAPPASHPTLPPFPRPSFRPPPPPSRGGRRRCQQKKLLLQLDEQLAVLRKLDEQREADIARSMSWVDGVGGPDADSLRRTAQQIPNVPIPYFPYVSNLPIYGRSDWTPLPLQPSYEYQVSGNRGPPIAGIYRRTWVPSQVPSDTLDCDYEDDRTLLYPGGVAVSTPAPNAFRGLHQGNPGSVLVSTSAPNNFRGPGFDGRGLRYPGGYGISPTPGPGPLRRDGYGRAWAPRVEVDDKVAKPEDDPAEDEEKE